MNIDHYLSIEDADLVKKSLLYVNVSLENELMKRITNEFTLLLRELFIQGRFISISIWNTLFMKYHG